MTLFSFGCDAPAACLHVETSRKPVLDGRKELVTRRCSKPECDVWEQELVDVQMALDDYE